jgi:hypothetical protein
MKAADIALARIYAQQVIRSNFTKAKDLVSYMGALQAQDYAMAKWAIGLRVPGSTEKEIEQSLNKGELLRAHVLRPTWHIIPAKNIYWMLALSAAKIKALMRTMDKQLELTEKIFTRSNGIIEKCLAEGNHVGREELATRLNKAHIQTTENRLSHLLLRAELEGIACSGKSTGNKKTYALLETRVPRQKLIDKNESLALLATSYFSSHGPATLEDFGWWSGLTLTDARHALENTKQQFNSEKLNGQEYWFGKNLLFPEKKKSAGVQLLPAYDEFIISYKDRTAGLAPEHHKKVLSNNGIFFPVIVADGQVVATWKKSVEKGGLAVEAHFFQPPPAKWLAAVTKRVKELGAFYEKKSTLKVRR